MYLEITVITQDIRTPVKLRTASEGHQIITTPVCCPHPQATIRQLSLRLFILSIISYTWSHGCTRVEFWFLSLSIIILSDHVVRITH